MEDFLEALLMLEEQGKPLQTTLVAEMLGVSKPAVHQMGHELIDRGYGDMTLLPAGRAIAESTLHRHRALKEYLLSLGVSEETAEHDCCLMEHVVSDETFHCMQKAMEKKQ